MRPTSAFTSAVLLNPGELRRTGVDSELHIHNDFGLHCIDVNELRRDDTQGVTGSSPVRPLNFFVSLAGVSLV
jgi:hypothetical protein